MNVPLSTAPYYAVHEKWQKTLFFFASYQLFGNKNTQKLYDKLGRSYTNVAILFAQAAAHAIFIMAWTSSQDSLRMLKKV